ncbi:MAG: hypothetical protein GY853_01825 [PVC group bacterium]|nr:hypothetical protein [PVC group bacterium]
MLSETYTIEDVKNRLRKPYSFYDFNSDDEFESTLITVSEDVKFLQMYPLVGTTGYGTIEDKDRVSLTAYEVYVYWAEIYYICYEFLKLDERTTGQRQTSSGSESLKVEGYQYQVNNSYGSKSQEDVSRGYFLEKARGYMKLAGFDMYSLERTCSIFGTTSASNDSSETLT